MALVGNVLLSLNLSSKKSHLKIKYVEGLVSLICMTESHVSVRPCQHLNVHTSSALCVLS